MSLGYILPALIGTLLSLAVPMLFVNQIPGGRGYQTTYLFFSLPMMLVTYIWPVVGYIQQKRAFRRAAQTRAERYRQYLHARRTELQQVWTEQQAALRQVDPDPAECHRRVKHRDPRLWERSPGDRDFLHLRMGIGTAPFAIRLKIARDTASTWAEPDPLSQEAHALVGDLETVPQVPVTLSVPEVGIAGLAGPRQRVLEGVRSLLLHMAAHHSPDEVKVVALFPADEQDQWTWLRWLPHVWSEDGRRRYLAADREGAVRILDELHDTLTRRKAPSPFFVMILADPSLAENTAAMPLLLDSPVQRGAATFVLAGSREGLPRECRAIIHLQGQGGELLETGEALKATPFVPDAAPADLAESFARAMAPIRIRRMTSPSATPTGVALFDLFGVSAVPELPLLELWQTAQPGRSLAVPVGLKAGGEALLLDVHEKGHGPHGLVAGATGSGKSELLQAVIASLAVHFHPHDLAFILVDYKGGALANVFRELPHLIGSITNLHGNLATRALAALKGELRRRQTLLGENGVSHVDDYQRLYREHRTAEPMPHLLFIVDEFAELKAEQPEFMRELISAVRVGRSLGVHLILATQKPAGVVDDQIWSNSRFRLCLRVERPEDSREVLKRPDAADLTNPGRAFFQVGNDECFDLFQAAWGGAPYIPGGPVVGTEAVAEVVLDGSRYVLSPLPKNRSSQGQQLQVLVQHIAAVAQKAGIHRLPGPWLPPLPEQVILADLVTPWKGPYWDPPQSWIEPVIGLVDNPQQQQQVPLRLPLGRDGHLAVYGAPGVGKTTFLRTLVTSLCLEHSPADLNLYLLDFGGRVLSLFSGYPHVGAVVLSDEEERLTRLFRFLTREVEIRKEAFGRAGVTTLPAYRLTAVEPLPAVVVVVDNFEGLTSSYPDAEETVAQLAREGSSYGIHLVLTASSYAGVRMRVSSNIMLTVALQQNDPGDYAMIVGRTGGLVPMSLPGRGLVRFQPPLEFQTALPFSGETEVERNRQQKALAQAMSAAWGGPRVREIAVLPEVVRLATVTPAIGLEVETLEPLSPHLRDGPHFLIAGPPESGKSTLLRTWLLALADRFTPAEATFYLVDFRGDGLEALQNLPHARPLIMGDDALTEAIAEIDLTLKERRQLPDAAAPSVVLAIDHFSAFRDGAGAINQEELERLVRRERGLGFHLLLAGATDDLSSAWDGVAKALKDGQTGFILGSADHSDLALLGVRVPHGDSGKLLPPGTGYFSCRGRARKFRAAVSDLRVSP